jgi:hypothetical protein
MKKHADANLTALVDERRPTSCCSCRPRLVATGTVLALARGEVPRARSSPPVASLFADAAAAEQRYVGRTERERAESSWALLASGSVVADRDRDRGRSASAVGSTGGVIARHAAAMARGWSVIASASFGVVFAVSSAVEVSASWLLPLTFWLKLS